MDYTDDDVAYAEQVAASSSDPFDSSGVGSHGFRDPVFGRYDGADELEAELRSITGREQQEERGERSTAGWGEAQRFGHYEQGE